MKYDIIRLGTTVSTSDYLRSCPTPQSDSMLVATATFQTSGRGQGSNTWESEAGKNLLVSILTSPTSVPADRQFVLSMAGALALKAALDRYCEGITLKWPNDIYWHDSKLSGTLIETSVRGKTICRCIYGIGLNVNQRSFHSDAPNPVSLYNIIGRETPLEEILDAVLKQFARFYHLATTGDGVEISRAYHAALYRRTGMYPYEDAQTHEHFLASIDYVDAHGLLHLRDEGGRERVYALKEVRSLSTIAATQESDHTFSAVSSMSSMVKTGSIMPMMATGAPTPDISESVRK